MSLPSLLCGALAKPASRSRAQDGRCARLLARLAAHRLQSCSGLPNRLLSALPADTICNPHIAAVALSVSFAGQRSTALPPWPSASPLLPCSFTVEWQATADAGKRAELRIGDLCRLDARPLTEHPAYEQYRAVLERRAAAGPAGGAVARRAAPAQRAAAAAGQPPEAISISDSEDDEAGQRNEQQQGMTAPRELMLRPPMGACGPRCALCRLSVVSEGDQLACSDEVRREFEGKYSQSNVVHKQ